MKTYFASIFTAVSSVPMGMLAAYLLVSLSHRPDIPATATIGAVVTGFVLVVALVLFVASLFQSKGMAT